MKSPGARASHRILPAMPSWARYVVAGFITACFAYAIWLLDRIEAVDVPPELVLEKTVTVPELDEDVLAQAKDASRRDRPDYPYRPSADPRGCS